MRLVFFDFDGTLTTRDTLWPLARLLTESRGRKSATRAAALLSLMQLRLHLRSNHSFKNHFLRLMAQGECTETVELLTKQFHTTRLEPMLNKDVFQALSQHTAAGDHVYLVSSNFDFFLKPLVERWNLRGVIATQTEVVEGKFTGRIVGRACDGKEKLARVVACFGEQRTREAVAYGDSCGDSFLLDFVKTGYWVGRGGNLGVRRSFSSTRCRPHLSTADARGRDGR